MTERVMRSHSMKSRKSLSRASVVCLVAVTTVFEISAFVFGEEFEDLSAEVSDCFHRPSRSIPRGRCPTYDRLPWRMSPLLLGFPAIFFTVSPLCHHRKRMVFQPRMARLARFWHESSHSRFTSKNVMGGLAFLTLAISPSFISSSRSRTAVRLAQPTKA